MKTTYIYLVFRYMHEKAQVSKYCWYNLQQKRCENICKKKQRIFAYEHIILKNIFVEPLKIK